MGSPVKIVIPISGGKDSQACLKLAALHHPASEIRGLFCDTQFEHPITYQHVERLRTMYGAIQIDTVCAGSVLAVCSRFKRWPGGGARHCTDYLKIRPTKLYLNALADAQGGFEVWYGMRSGESSARAKRYAGKVGEELYAPHEVLPNKYPKYLEKKGVMFRLPLLDWSEEDVFAFIEGEENPLYLGGFDRVGCFPCMASGDKWKEMAFAFDSFGHEQKRKVIAISNQIGKSPWTSKGGEARNATCGLVCGS